MLSYTFDISTRVVTPLGIQSFRRGDEEQVRITLTDDGTAYELGAGEVLIFTLKGALGLRSADPLVRVSTDDWTNAANVYTANLVADGAELTAALDALPVGTWELSLVGDISWQESVSSRPRSSSDLAVVCKNDVERDTDGVPVASTTLWQRIKAMFPTPWFIATDNAQTIAPAIASQAEAQAGTANNKLMTPERTAQAIAALGGSGSGAWADITDKPANLCLVTNSEDGIYVEFYALNGSLIARVLRAA